MDHTTTTTAVAGGGILLYLSTLNPVLQTIFLLVSIVWLVTQTFYKIKKERDTK